MSSVDWSQVEIAASVSAYLEMLEMELRGEAFNKSAHRRVLMGKLNNRSEASVEKRHQNISSVMKELGYPQIAGYKPLPNFNRQSLFSEVARQLQAKPNLGALIARAVDASAAPPNVREGLNKP